MLLVRVVTVYQWSEFISEQRTRHGSSLTATVVKSSAGCEAETEGQV